MKAALVTFVFLSASLWAEKKPEPLPEALIFTNVNVVNTRSGTIDHNMMVVVKKGRIDGIAKVGLIGRGHNLLVINATGKYLMPGLWDMHVHSAFAPGAWDEKIIYPLYIANGVTGVRDMGGDPNLLEQRRQRIDQGELIGPRMILAGPFLDGGKSDAQLIAVTTPAEARAAVDGLKKRGVDFVKILSRLDRDSYFAVAEESAKQKLTFVGHVPDSVSAAEASAAGQHSIEHLTGVLLACSSKESELRQQKLAARASHDSTAYAAIATQVMATYDRAKASALFIQFVDNATWQVPTLVWTQANANLDDPSLKSDPRLKYVPASVRQEWDPEKLLKQTSPGELAGLKKEFARDLELVDAMHHASVPFMAGSDGPDPYVFPGFSLHDELELLVKSGFNAVQALQAATFNPALFLGKLDKYGVVEKGDSADLVLLDANPLEDISNTRKIAAVVMAGKYYAREDLDKMLIQVEAAAAKQ
jgi:imidazolonepropionase-like amidohydrolase